MIERFQASSDRGNTKSSFAYHERTLKTQNSGPGYLGVGCGFSYQDAFSIRSSRYRLCKVPTTALRFVRPSIAWVGSWV